MEKMHKGQLAKILVVFLFLLVIPFVSASMRTSYLYFILNLLIVVLAVDSGLIRAFPNDPSEDKLYKPITITTTSSSPPAPHAPAGFTTTTTTTSSTPPAKETNVEVGKVAKLKRCPSMPSLFFIGDGDEDGDFVNQGDSETEEDEAAADDVVDVSGQELFLKAEAFIGNFYRQLKIQREESWKRIHGLCHRPL